MLSHLKGREDQFGQVTSKLRFVCSKGVSHIGIWGKNILGKTNTCKSSEDPRAAVSQEEKGRK